jgi:hypothetical protein
MRALTCAAVQRRLNAFYDRELSIGEQIAMAAHLDLCRDCAEALDDLRAVGDALRAGASVQAVLSVEEAVGFRAGVVNRVKAEHDTSFVARVRLMFEDMHLVYAGVGATAATLVCVSIMLGMMRYATNEHPASLAAMVSFLATPGSNADAAAIDAESQARWTARFEAANETAEQETVFTLAEALTHEGRIAKLEHLRATDRKSQRGGAAAPAISDAKLIEGLLDAVSRARLGPAQAEGLPASSNMVWMITRTTVRASQSAVPVDLPLPPAPKKRAAVPATARPSITVA